MATTFPRRGPLWGKHCHLIVRENGSFIASVFDVLIAGGQIIDGSGNVGFPGAVGIDGDTVQILRGDVATIEARQRIDATGRVVCPGFIDFHAHSGLVILAEPRHEPKVHQGVTTEIIGVDGNSYAPFRSQADLAQFIQLNSGLDGNPTLTQKWATVAQYPAHTDHSLELKYK